MTSSQLFLISTIEKIMAGNIEAITYQQENARFWVK